ncbi:DMT family transporter [Marinisporobacter balticus]|uniref:Drug/metabolite transporter (DMT)-like permease n=1 Tax=Marinisporobacter balticus TaxID=2018667 RepID=A0A4R2KFM9_9FIRM|nr:DMT family transporter [Marinisporobacter balticus]TCO71037.1 drug/metabolite transporter (DMT)-like permease [Marinisporobacter balticus]
MSTVAKGINKRRGLYADLSLLLVAIIWGGGFIVTKDILDILTPFYMNALRFTVASVTLAIIFWKKTIKITKKDLKYGSIVGMFLWIAFITQTIGLQYTTVSKSAFLTGTNVVIVPFLVWMVTKKCPDLYGMLGAFFSVIGIGLLTYQGGLNIEIGDALTLVCAIFFAAHITSVGHFAENVDPIILAIIQMGVTGILSLMGAFIFETTPQFTGNVVDLTSSLSYMTFVSTMGAFFIQNVAQKYTVSTHAAIILSLESVFGTLFGVMLMGDILNGTMIIGCVLIFCAIIIAETKLSFLFPKKE